MSFRYSPFIITTRVLMFLGTLVVAAIILDYTNDSLIGIALSALLVVSVYNWLEKTDDTIEIEAPKDDGIPPR